MYRVRAKTEMIKDVFFWTKGIEVRSHEEGKLKCKIIQTEWKMEEAGVGVWANTSSSKWRESGVVVHVPAMAVPSCQPPTSRLSHPCHARSPVNYGLSNSGRHRSATGRKHDPLLSLPFQKLSLSTDRGRRPFLPECIPVCLRDGLTACLY